MWVPTGEKKLTGTFEEKTVSHETTLEEKAPTERKIQEHKEKVGTLWDEDEDMFCEAKAAAGKPQSKNGKRTKGGGGGGNGKNLSKGRPIDERQPPPEGRQGSVVLEAAKFKASTVKDWQ